MPFRNYHQFDLANVRLMTAAYDAAIAQLSLTPDNPLTGKLAAAIAALADDGERDPAKLCEQAVAKLKAETQKPRR
jgi:hypothetical protein